MPNNNEDVWRNTAERAEAIAVLIALLIQGAMDIPEFLVFYTAFEAMRVQRVRGEDRFRHFQPIQIETWSAFEVWTEFRFTLPDLHRIYACFQWPENGFSMPGERPTHSTSFEAFLIVMHRLANPGKWASSTKIFGPHKMCHLSSMLTQCMACMLQQKSHLITNLPEYYTNPANLRKFASAVYKKTGLLHNIVAFIDGTCKRICRPKYFQRAFFSGHKRYHCLKFQHLLFPDGIIGHQYGPIEGRHSDSWLFNASNMETLLKTRFRSPYGPVHVPPPGSGVPPPHVHDGHVQYAIFADSGYARMGNYVHTPYRRAHPPPTEAEKTFNKAMSRARVAIEWSFGKIVNIFAFLSYWRQLKIWLVPVGQYYQLATLMANCHTCLYGSQTTQHFEVAPPSLEEYLHWPAPAGGAPAA